MKMRFATGVSLALLSIVSHSHASTDALRDVFAQQKPSTKPPPEPEPISVAELALPPALTNATVGACTWKINPRGTGCIGTTGLQSGDFLPDNNHIVASVTFVGAPAAPNPASIYSGLQVILLKISGTFPNGDRWKCITCGVSAANRVGATALIPYPQAFRDGVRAMAGTNIIDCGKSKLASKDCTPDKVHIYPIRFSNTANDDGSGPGGNIRELRLHPDQVHLGFSAFNIVDGNLDENAFFGRLCFNATGSNGTDPRYEVVNVTILQNPNATQPVSVTGSQLFINPSAISVGELRGFTGSGKEITYIGFPAESCNFDVFAVDMISGKVRRITTHPEYVDPMSVSPDDNWQVVLDTRGTNRQMYMSGLRTVPPVTDLVSSRASSSTRNNGERRFFEPWLLDHDGDRGLYFGQKISAAGDGSPGSINDPYWNARADPRWSLDGNKIQYYQLLVLQPACGGSNPLPCVNSTYPDNREQRVMVATLTSRKPYKAPLIAEASDSVPWGTKYTPGMAIPKRPSPPEGNFTLQGRAFGHANVSITYDSTKKYIKTVSALYNNFSDDGFNTLIGTETVSKTPLTLTLTQWDWTSDLTSVGQATGTKRTSADGFQLAIDVLVNLFEANGTLTTTINGVVFEQPCNGC